MREGREEARIRAATEIGCNQHGTIVRRKGKMICNKNRDQRSGVRDQKRKELEVGRRFDLRDEGLTTKWGAPLE